MTEHFDEQTVETVEEQIVHHVPEKKVTLSDASILLTSGKQGFIFIGVIVAFFLLSILLSFVDIPLIVYLVAVVVIAPIGYFFYLRAHANDESKLD